MRVGARTWIRGNETASGSGQPAPQADAAYFAARAAANFGHLCRVLVVGSGVVAVSAALAFLDDPTTSTLGLNLGLLAPLVATLVVLRCTPFGKKHVELLVAIVATYVLLGYVLVLYWKTTALVLSNQERCDSLNLSITVGRHGGDERDGGVGGGGGSTTERFFFCDNDLFGTNGGLYGGGTGKYVFFYSYAEWVTNTTFVILLCRFRFPHAVLVAGVTGVANLVLGFSFLVQNTDTDPVVLVYYGLTFYGVAFLTCLWGAYYTEELHRAHYALTQQQQHKMKIQSQKIRRQSGSIEVMTEKLAAAQEMVSSVMDGATLLTQYELRAVDLDQTTVIGEGVSLSNPTLSPSSPAENPLRLCLPHVEDFDFDFCSGG